ncbi:glycosyltransferase [Cyanobacterium aponinum UTEX 3222]|uniref:glycosyltransferase n=1 Tax=Cyanobacterium aponinum TaxID=379064 RepID=UPI002B4BA92C|nr:glycosyltransferase [Cyanobacterium aponinum]WRL37712.1 glycosyltransferase [Cyanobacterium aponinum UTEX 3221]WRL41817.1 glycosyltransferase [Cyanobacterium aponinum UTEX 3222]
MDLSKQKILYSHHWSYIERQRHPIFSHDEIYITSYPDQADKIINLPIGTSYDVREILTENYPNWQPDLFIAKVDSFFNVIPRNVKALDCPKILILGDTQHGVKPLERMIEYAKSEKYDFYITDHKRHHLWYYYLARIPNLYWLPGLFLNPPQGDLKTINFEDSTIEPDFFTDKVIFVGQASKFHPRRKAILEYLHQEIPNFWSGRLSQRDSLKAFSQAQISLNISLNGDLNLRFFEIISAGGFLLTDTLAEEAGMNLLLEEGKEYESFENIEQLINKIKYFVQYPELIEEYKKRSHQRYLENYTPEKHKNNLENILEGKFINEIYYSNFIERINYFPESQYTQKRIEIYQIVQGIHKYTENLTIFIDIQFFNCYVEDFLDLPRITVSILDYIPYNFEKLIEYLGASKNLHKVKFTNDKHNNNYDILIIESINIDLFLQGNKQYFTVISNDDHSWQEISIILREEYPHIKFTVNKYTDFFTIHVERQNILKEKFTDKINLTAINYIIFPDWQSDEETLTQELYNLISSLAKNSLSSKDLITLVIDRTGIMEEDANLFLSGIAMNLMMEEELDLENILDLALINNLNDHTWNKLLPKITAKITLENENQDIVNQLNLEDLVTIEGNGNNYAIFPDWKADQEELALEIGEVLMNLSDQENCTLLVNLNNVDQEEVGLFFSEIAMNLMLTEDIELSNNLQINFVNFTAHQWQSLEGLIKGKITINYEDLPENLLVDG